MTLPHDGGGADVVVVFAMVSIEFESVCEFEIMSIMNCLQLRYLPRPTTFHCSYVFYAVVDRVLLKTAQTRRPLVCISVCIQCVCELKRMGLLRRSISGVGNLYCCLSIAFHPRPHTL